MAAVSSSSSSPSSSSSSVTVTVTVTAAKETQATLQEELAIPILLATRLIKSATESTTTTTSRAECGSICYQATSISVLLRSLVRLTTSSPSPYHRPIRRVAADTTSHLHRALSLLRKCNHAGLLRHLFLSITNSAGDFKKVEACLASSAADLKWLLSIYGGDGDGGDGDDGIGGIPPIASNEPIIAWVWTSIVELQVNRRIHDRIEAATRLASWANSSHHYRKVIVEEGGVSPLLRLLKDGGGCPEGQAAAATALCWLAENDEERCRAIASDNNNQGIPIIVQVLAESSMFVQIAVADLVAKIAEADAVAREELGRENVMKPLVSCLVYDSDMDDYRKYHSGGGKSSLSLHSVVQTAKNRNYDYVDHTNNSSSSYHKLRSTSSLAGASNSKKDRENESPEVKHKLKTKCALALWRLCENSLMNSQKIAEPKGFFCLSKTIETEKGELRFNCLMAIMEVAKVAEGNAELRKVAWKPSSPPTKAVLDQLRTVIKEENDRDLQISAIKSIGCLARIFPAKESGLVSTLVGKLGDDNVSVAIEATMALAKFACPDNHICVEHSKTIIEFNGIPLLMKLMGASERAKREGLVLLCYLSTNVGNSKALVEARALRTLESAVRSGIAQNAELREIIAKAMGHLMLYQDGSHPHGHGFELV